MSDSLGRLELGLGVDLPGLESGLIAADRAIERYKSRWSSLSGLTIKPLVDDSQLTALNKHLSLKQSHLGQVRSDFAKPLMVTADYTSLDEFSRKLDRLHKQQQKGFGFGGGQTNLNITIDTNGLARSVQRGVEKGFKDVGSGGILASIGRGAFEGLGRELFGGISKSFSSQIDSVLSSTIGSSDLLGKKLAEKAGSGVQNLVSRARNASPVADRLITQASDGVRGFVGDRDIAIEVNRKRGRDQRAADRNLKLAREGIVGERQQSTQEFDSAYEDLRATKQRLAPIQARVDRRDAPNQARLREIEQQRQAEVSRLAKDKENQIRQLQERQATANPIERSALSNQISSISSRELVSPQLAKLEFDRKQVEIKRAPIQRVQDTIDENLESRAARFATAKNRKEAATRQTESLFPQSQPKVYQDLLDELAPKLKDRLVPKLVSDPTLKNRGANGDYAVASNTIRLNPDTYKAVQSGKPLSDKDYKILYEELKHASDLKFGQFEGLQSRASGRLIGKPIKASPEEEAAIASELNAYRKEDRPFERQAKIARDRSLPKYQAQRSLDNINEVAGLSGLDYLKTTNKTIGTTDSLLGSISSAVGKNNIDAPSLTRIQAKQEQLKAVRVKILEDIQAAQAGDLSRDKIVKLEADLDRNIAEIESTKRRAVGLAKGVTTARPEESEDLWAVNKGSKLLPNRRNQRRRSSDTSRGQPIGDLSIWEDRVESVVPEIVAPEKESFFNRSLSTAKSVGGFIRKAGTPVAQVARNSYDALEGAENAVAPYVPFFKQIKAVGKNVVLPAAVYGALGMVPGGEVVQGALGNAAHGLLSLPGAGAVDAVTSAVGSAVGGIPMIGEALTAGAGTLTAGAVDTIVTTMTPIVAGKVALKLVGKGAQLALPTKKPEYDYVEAGQNTTNKVISAAANLTETTYERLPGAEESLALPPAKKGSLVQAANKARSNSLDLKPTPKAEDDLMPIESSSSLLNNARTGLRNIRRKLKDAVDKGNTSLATQLDKQFGEQLDLFEKFSGENLVGKGANSDSRLNISNWRKDRAKFAKKIELVREDKDDFAPLNSIDLSPRSPRPLRSFRPQPRVEIPASDPDDFESQFQPLAALSRSSQRRKRANIQAGQKRRSVVDGEFVDESALTIYRGELAPIPGDVRERLNVDPRSIPPPPPPRPNFATDGEFVDPVRRKRQRRLSGEARQRVNAQTYESPQNYPEIPDPFGDNEDLRNGDKKDPSFFRSFRKKISDASDLREQQGRFRRGAKPRNILDPNQYPEDAAYEANNNAKSASSEFDRAERLIREREARNLYGANRIAAGGVGSGGNPPDALSYGIDRVRNAAENATNPLGGLGNIATTAVTGFLAFKGIAFVAGIISSIGGAAAKTALDLETLTIGTRAVSESNYAASQSIQKSQGLAKSLGFNPLDAIKGTQSFKAATQGTDIEKVSDEVFASSQKYGRLIGQSSESQRRSQIQLQQIGSKPTLTYEDVGQLSESLPGAPAKIAQGLGTNLQGLRKLTATGGVSGTDALIGLQQGFDAATSVGLDAAVNSNAASLGRLQGSIVSLQAAGGEKILAPLGAGAKIAGGLIDGLANNIDTLTTVFTAALVVAGARSIIFAVQAAGAAAGVTGIGAAAQVAAAGIASSAVAIGTVLLPFGLLTAGVYLVIEAFKGLNSTFDNTNPMSSYADAAERMLARMNGVSGGVKGVAKNLADTAKEAAEKEFLPKRGLFEGISDTYTGFSRSAIEKGAGLRKALGITANPNDYQGETFVDRKTNNTTESLNRAQAAQAIILAKPLDLSFKAEKEKIDLEINRLSIEAKVTPASDRGRLAQLQKEIQDKNVELGKVIKEPVKKRGEFDAIVKQTNETLTNPFYADNKEALSIAREQKASAEAKSAELDKSISTVRDSLAELSVSIRKTAGNLGNAIEQINDRKFDRDTKFNNSGINPLDTGARSGFQFASTQADLKDKIAAYQISKSDAEKALQNPTAKTQIGQFQKGGFLPKNLSNTTDEQLSEIKSDDGSEQLIKAIKAYRDADKQIRSLASESASGSREFQSAIAENARSVRDYNQSLTYNAQRLTIEVQQTEHSLQAQGFAGKLQAALSGVNDAFSGYFASGIELLVESGKAFDIEANRRKAQVSANEGYQKALQDNSDRQLQVKKPGEAIAPTTTSTSTRPQNQGSGLVVSPLAAASIDQLIAYKPRSEGINAQAFTDGRRRSATATRVDGFQQGAQIHGANDYDVRVGGGIGGVVQSPISGKVKSFDAGKGMGQIVQVAGIDASGTNTTVGLTHVSTGLKTGDRVDAGQLVGKVVDNKTGADPHLDFTVIQNGVKIDPQKWLAKQREIQSGKQKQATSVVKSVVAATNKPIAVQAPSSLNGLANFIGKRESNNNYYALQGGGSFPKSAAIGGFPKGLENQNIGRYQFKKSDFNSARKVDPTITGFTPEDQDKIFRVKVQQRAGKELAAFQSNSSEANADRLRVALGQEWEVLRDGKARYKGKDTGKNYFGGDKSKREFYQAATSRPQLGTVSAGLVNALLPGASYDVAPPTPLGTNTTPEQQTSQLQTERTKLDDEFGVKQKQIESQADFDRTASLLKQQSLRNTQATQKRQGERTEAGNKLTAAHREQDRSLTTGNDTPERVLERQRIANERSAFDSNRDLKYTREDLGISLKGSRKAIGTIEGEIKDKAKFNAYTPEQQKEIQTLLQNFRARVPVLEKAIAAYDKLIVKSATVSKSVAADTTRKAGDRQIALNTSTDASVIKGLISLKQEQAKTIETFQKDRPTDFSKGDPLVLKKEIAILQAQSTKLTETQSLRERRRTADPTNQKKIDGEIANVGKVADKSIANANAEFTSAKEQRDIGFTSADIERQRARAGSFGTLGAAQADLFKVQRKANPFDYSKPIASIEGSYQIAAEDSRYATAKRELESRSRIDKTQASHFAELARLEDERHAINMKSINKSINLAEIEEQIQGQRVSFDRAQFNTGLELGTSSSRAGLAKAQRKDSLAQDIEDEAGRKKIRSEYDAAVQNQIEILQRSPDDPTAKGTFVGRVQELNSKRQLDLDTIDAAKVTRDREKVFNQGSLLSGSRSAVTSAEGERAGLAGNNFDARNINYRSAVIGQGQEFRVKQKELEDLRTTGAITTEQFKLLSDELTQLNEIKLDNLARQFSPITDAIKGVSDKFGDLVVKFTEGSKDTDKSLRDFLASPFRMVRDEATKYLTSALSNQLTKWLKPDLAKNVPPIEPRKLLGNPEVLGPIEQPSIAVPSPKLGISLAPILPPIEKTPDLGFTIPPAPTRENTVGSPIYAPNVVPAAILEAENPPPSTYLIRVGNSIVDRRTLPSYQPPAISAPLETPSVIPGSPFFQPRSLDQIQSSSAPTPVSIVSDLTPPKNAPANISIAGGGGGGDFGSKLTRGVGSTLLRGISGGGFSPLGMLGGLISGLFADGGIVGDELDLPAYASGGIHSPQRFQHGIIPGYSPKDDTLAVVMRGEAFLTQRATARLGKDGVDALNKGQTPPIFMPNFSLGAMPELPHYADAGIHGGVPAMSAAAMSSATNFGDNINNIGGSSNYSFVLNNSGGGNPDVSSTMNYKDVVKAETMDLILRLKRQGVL